MPKIYQPIVIKEMELIIEDLIETKFFKDYEITDYTFAKSHLSDILTDKFIDGQLDEDEILFDEDEFTKILQEIVAGSVLYELKGKGLVDSYSDDNTEEMFFLTEEGKKLLNENQDFC